MDWELYKAMLIGKISGIVRSMEFYGSPDQHVKALQKIADLVGKYDAELEKRIRESEAKLNG